MPPQLGSHMSVNIPINQSNLQDNSHLQDLEPLGWIHTQPSELPDLSPQDVITQAKLMDSNKNWLHERVITITCSFTPGSVTLTAYRLTSQGFEWGKENKELANTGTAGTLKNFAGFASTHFEKIQMLLSGWCHIVFFLFFLFFLYFFYNTQICKVFG